MMRAPYVNHDPCILWNAISVVLVFLHIATRNQRNHRVVSVSLFDEAVNIDESLLIRMVREAVMPHNTLNLGVGASLYVGVPY